jgi:hypothetical protein
VRDRQTDEKLFLDTLLLAMMERAVGSGSEMNGMIQSDLLI